MQTNKVIFIHSLNNFTGSPNVLSVIVRGFLKRGYQAEIITSRGDGFLSDIADVAYKHTCYNWNNNQIVTLIRLLLSQFELFFKILFYSRKYLYYINTIVPFGAIMACRLTGKHFVIHIHENMQQRKQIYTIFRAVYRRCNEKSIFVSNYLRHTALNCREGRVIYNSLPDVFFQTAAIYSEDKKEDQETILMVASQRRFKGIYELVELSKAMPHYPFELVLSSNESEVEQFRKEIGEIPNLTIYSLQKNLHPFYQRAKLLLQLSHPESCVETFGLTILEAMVYGIPSIVPNVGGPIELVDNEVNGYTVNPHDIPSIANKITSLMENERLYQQFSEAALRKSTHFSEETMTQAIEDYITEQNRQH